MLIGTEIVSCLIQTGLQCTRLLSSNMFVSISYLARLYVHPHVHAHDSHCLACTENETGFETNQICALKYIFAPFWSCHFQVVSYFFCEKYARNEIATCTVNEGKSSKTLKWRRLLGRSAFIPMSCSLFKMSQTAKSHQLIHFSLSTTNNMQVREEKEKSF